jgi:hypothetical protein
MIAPKLSQFIGDRTSAGVLSRIGLSRDILPDAIVYTDPSLLPEPLGQGHP